MTLTLRRKHPEPPIPHLTEAEMDAILAEPIWETVQRGENVALEPYARPLFDFMASFCPKPPPPSPVRLASRVVAVGENALSIYTGASAAYSCSASAVSY